MPDKDQFQVPLDPVEALMSVRAIIDATRDGKGSMPMEAALQLIDIVLDRALLFFEERETQSED